MHSKTKGDIGQALVVTQILENDCSAFIDFGDNSKIDLIVEDKEGKLHKIQVKYYKRDNSSENITSLYIKKSGPNYRFRYEEKDVDWFAVVDSKTKKIAWVSAKGRAVVHFGYRSTTV